MRMQTIMGERMFASIEERDKGIRAPGLARRDRKGPRCRRPFP
jgi:hypothetical protein